ncbi:MAG: HIT family protein [Promethearchaeota archaeon]
MVVDEDCIFCKIAKGEAPATLLYEDEDCLAFMDIFPATRGHAIVTPRQHYAGLEDAPVELFSHVASVAKELAVKVLKALKAGGVNILVNNGKAAGQVVPHLHMHVIPRYGDERSLSVRVPKEMASPAELAAVASEIRGEI